MSLKDILICTCGHKLVDHLRANGTYLPRDCQINNCDCETWHLDEAALERHALD